MNAELVAPHWSAIEEWLASHAPGIFASLRSGLSDDALARLRGELAVELPDNLQMSMRRHDGQEEDAPDGIFPFSGSLGPEPSFRLLSAAEIIREWRLMKELLDGGEFKRPGVPDSGVAGAWWHIGWVPVAGNGSGDLFCVDLASMPDGFRGQVILFAHDSPKRRRVAESFGTWLGGLAEGLLSGRYEYSEEDGIVASE